jgi:hypothetical protein
MEQLKTAWVFAGLAANERRQKIGSATRTPPILTTVG